MYEHLFALHATLLKALAHPRRLEIIHLLRDQELAVSDIHTMLDLPQANISQHLTVLRDAGVVTTRRDGKQVFYKLSDDKIIVASDLLREVLVQQHKQDALASATELAHTMSELLPITTDPVCKMRVSPKTAGFHTKHNNTDYYFCASGCKAQFNKEPKRYV